MQKRRSFFLCLGLYLAIALTLNSCFCTTCDNCPEKPNCIIPEQSILCLDYWCPDKCCPQLPEILDFPFCPLGNEMVDCVKGELVFINTKDHPLYYYYDYGGDCRNFKLGGSVEAKSAGRIIVPPGKSIPIISFWKEDVGPEKACFLNSPSSCQQLTDVVGASGTRTCAVLITGTCL